MRHEGPPEGFDPTQGEPGEVQWLRRDDGEPLDIHVQRNEYGDVISTSFRVPSTDRIYMGRVKIPGELTQEDCIRLHNMFRDFMKDLEDHPQDFFGDTEGHIE